jgi:hypothetical protein
VGGVGFVKFLLRRVFVALGWVSFCAFREFSFKVVERGFYLPDTQAEFERGFISAIKKQS